MGCALWRSCSRELESQNEGLQLTATSEEIMGVSCFKFTARWIDGAITRMSF